MIDYDTPTQPVEYIYQSGPGGKERRGCFGGCLSRLMLLVIAGLAILVFSGAAVAATLVYSSFSQEIEEDITALNSAYDQEVFETTRIYDRNKELL